MYIGVLTVLGLIVPWTIVPWTVRTLLDCSYHGLFVPSMDFSYLDYYYSEIDETFTSLLGVGFSSRPGFRPYCLSQHGTNRPVMVRTVHGTNSPGYEKSRDGTNNPWYEQSGRVRTVHGKNSPR